MDFEQRIRELESELEEKKHQIADILHRSKNDYAMMSGILGLESTNVDGESAKILEDCSSRLRILADMNQSLYVEDTDAVYMPPHLYNIADARISASAKGHRINVKYDIDDIYLRPKLATYCGLATNEILTNAIKHAFNEDPFSDRNEISISLKYTGPENARFEISDNGCGMKDTEDDGKYHLGKTLIDSFVKSVDGTLTVRSEPGTGTSYSIEFYLPKDRQLELFE